MVAIIKRILPLCSSALAVAALFFLPSIADGATGVTLLAPSVTGGAKTVSDAGKYLEMIYVAAIGFAGVLAVMILVWGGFEYIMSGADPSMRTEANKRIWAALGGLILLLASYTILETINPDFVGFGVSLSLPPSTSSSGTQTGGAGAPPGSGITHAQAIELINYANERFKDTEAKNAKISVSSSGNCTSSGNATCTSLDGMQKDSMLTAVNLARACNCEVIITGGTEVGHANGTISHGNGTKFDIRAVGVDGAPTAVTRFITDPKNEFTVGKRTEANGKVTTTYTDKYGTVYAYEINGRDGKPHWDITPATTNAVTGSRAGSSAATAPKGAIDERKPTDGFMSTLAKSMPDAPLSTRDMLIIGWGWIDEVSLSLRNLWK